MVRDETFYCAAHSCALATHIVLEEVGAAYSTVRIDFDLFTLAQWLEVDGVEPARTPRVIDHRRRVSERAAVRQAIAQEH